jgi:hypothetical protein
LAGPCFGGDVDAAKGVQDCLAATDDRRIIDGRKVGWPSLERRVHCPNGNNSARSLDATGRPRVPGEADAVEFFLKRWIHWLNCGTMRCHAALLA